jgi:hypothetical protein
MDQTMVVGEVVGVAAAVEAEEVIIMMGNMTKVLTVIALRLLLLSNRRKLRSLKSQPCAVNTLRLGNCL